MQDQDTFTVLAGPLKVSVAVAPQLLNGTIICTVILWLGGRVPPAGVNVMPLMPLLLADQGKLTIVDVFVTITVQTQLFPLVHCEFATMLIGLTESIGGGGGCTVRVTVTRDVLVPMLIDTVSL